MIASYDTDSGLKFLDYYVKKSIEISDEFKNAFTEIKRIIDSGMTPSDGWLKWAESMDYTDRELLSFLSDVDFGKRSIQDMEAYIESASKQTTLFSRGLSAAKTVLGTVSSTLINMAAVYAITKGIELIGTAIYNAVHATKIAIEKGEEAKQVISDINDYI